MKKILSVCMAAAACMAANAQLTVLPDGKAYVGEMPASVAATNDANSEVSFQIFGKGESGSNGKLTFGDYGRRAKNGMNVMIGEYGDGDTDQLWLHGKNGIYFTNQRAYNAPICYYDTQANSSFVFNTGVKVRNLFIESDKNQMDGVTNLVSQLENLQKLNGVKFNLKSAAVVDSAEKAKAAFGIIAQDLEKVYPELVTKDTAGMYSVDYIGLIPVLVESVKELQTKIEALELRVSNSATGNPQINAGYTSATLMQNRPNPFSSETVIEYYVPASTNNASIIVYDMNGVQLKEYDIDGTGDGSITINASELYAGMFIYALLVDGHLADSKRMVLTK